jgi:hypothetical protein
MSANKNEGAEAIDAHVKNAQIAEFIAGVGGVV